jgi:hypothetical protein
MRGLTFEKPKKRYSLSECYANFLTILRIYRTTMLKNRLRSLFLFKFDCHPKSITLENSENKYTIFRKFKHIGEICTFWCNTSINGEKTTFEICGAY